MYEVYTGKGPGLKRGKHFNKKSTASKFAKKHKHSKMFKLTEC